MNLPAIKHDDTHVTPLLKLQSLIGTRETMDLVELSKKSAKLERHWVALAKAEITETTDRILTHARKTGRLSVSDVDFSDLFMQHSYSVMREGLESTKRRTPARVERLAAPPKGSIPRSLKTLREWWDKYRKTKRPGKRQKDMAERLKKAYVDALQKAWKENSDDFLSGETARNTEAVAAIMRRAAVTQSRASMIVETETTHYWNRARREIYDASDDVTHYLFVAIRDHATTKWCKSRQGLVYAKGDPILDKETPPIHWHCRSELLPLTPQNAAHLALIQEKRRARRSNSPEPLPSGWTGRS
jgi:SPP1 gp7 family putative phage head morphogenesis protein